MKKILIIHTKYRHKGGEDIAVENEITLLKENYEVEELYFINNIQNFFQQAISFIFNTNKNSNNLLNETIQRFNPDYAYVHNTWFKASLGIFNILKKNNIKVLLKLHNFRYDCTKSFLSKNHIRSGDFCNACGMKKNSINFFNKYFDESYLKSFLVVLYGKKYFKILKSDYLKILVLTDFHKEFLSKLLNKQKNIFVLPNYIEITENSKSVKKEEYILYAGRVSREKGIEELIKSYLCATLLNTKLKIIGSGPQLSVLKKKYETNDVEFMGEIANKEVIELIANAKAVVTATKLYEGQPTLLCEASSMGVVSIFPRTGGILEFFPKQYPFAYKQFDYEDLTKKISSLENQEKVDLIGKSNKDFIANYLDKEILAEKFIGLTDD
tara:strand:+ start:6413 stop:7561 length:1149 start_codon:yes stop_codon:yes gene_type:complete